MSGGAGDARDIERQRGELVDAACARGWDGPATASVELAEGLLASAPAVVHSDFLAACIGGEEGAVARWLDTDPDLARRKLPPRDWEPLLYLSFDLLLRPAGARASALVEVARKLLARGADPNAHYISRVDPSIAFPALYAAIAITQNLALAEVLLEAGANPNDGQSLYHAAERDDTLALELLARHGLDAKDVSYCLLHKIDFGHEPGIRWFLDQGADPNHRHPKSLETSLHWAIKRARPARVIQLLLERGADANARTRSGHTEFPRIRGFTPLDLAARLGRTDLEEILAAHGAQASPRTPADDFMVACAHGDAATARRLLAEHPGLMEGLPEEDRTLVANLGQQGSQAGIELMVDLGFPANAGGWGGTTALHWAACLGNRPLVRSLLARGVPPVDLGPPARTPLHQALYARWKADGDYVGVLEELVTSGVQLPADLAPTGDEELDAAVARLRAARPGK